MQTTTQSYHHRDLRNALIQAANDAVERDGAEKLSLRAVAERTGVTHRAVYRHFEHREALLAAVLEQAYLGLAIELEATSAARAEQRLLKIAEVFFEFALSRPNMFLAMTGPRINEDGGFASLESAIERSFNCAIAAVKQMLKGSATPSDTRAAASFYWGALQGIVQQVVLRRIKLSPRRRAAFITLVAERLVAGLKM